MQFDDPRSTLDSAAAKPSRGIDPHALIERGRILRRARYASGAAGLALVVAAASASLGFLGSDRGKVPPAGDLGAVCSATGLTASVHIRVQASEAEVAALRNELEASPDLARVRYVSAAAGLDELRQEIAHAQWVEGLPAHFVPPSFRVEAVDEAALERVADLNGPAIERVATGKGAVYSCWIETYCAEATPVGAVYLRDDASPEEVRRLQARVRSLPGITGVEHVSKQEAYQEFRKLYEDDPNLYETPPRSVLPASLRIKGDAEAIRELDTLSSPAIDEVRSSSPFREQLCPDVPVREPADPSVIETADPMTYEPAAEVVLLREECGTSLPGLGRARFTNGDRGAWCRFVVRVDNEGEVPIVLEPSLQQLSSKVAVRRPRLVEVGGSWSTRLFEAIPPGQSRLGQMLYLLREDEAPVALEIRISEGSRPIQFEVQVSCAGQLSEDEPGSCKYERGDEYGGEYLLRGDVLEGNVEVELYHCGIMPVAFDKRSWVADPPPFDATNAPETFEGRGKMMVELGSLSATYVDDSGISFEMRTVEDWDPPPCA